MGVRFSSLSVFLLGVLFCEAVGRGFSVSESEVFVDFEADLWYIKK